MAQSSDDASWPSAAELLRQELASSPLGPLSQATLDALAADLAQALGDGRVELAMETFVLTGRSPR